MFKVYFQDGYYRTTDHVRFASRSEVEEFAFKYGCREIMVYLSNGMLHRHLKYDAYGMNWIEI